MTSHARPVLAFLLLFLASLACASPTPTPTIVEPSPTPAPEPISRPITGRAVPLPENGAGPNSFAPYQVAEVNSASNTLFYAFDLEGVSNAALAEPLTPTERAVLEERGFVVLPAPLDTPFDVYIQAGISGDPVFITADLVIYVQRLLTGVAVQRAERDYLFDHLRALSATMAAAAEAQRAAAPDVELAAAARQNAALFSVATSLLDPSYVAPESVAAVVADEMTLITEAQGLFISPLTGQELDYRAFAPFSASVDSRLTRFQQALSWYGLIDLNLSSADPTMSREAARRVLLMVSAVGNTENAPRWERVYTPVRYLHGEDDSLTLEVSRRAAEAVYGQIPQLPWLTDITQLDNFIATVRALDTSGHFFVFPLTHYPDDTILSSLAYDDLGFYTGAPDREPFTRTDTNIGPVRGIPRGFDVATVLGSADALDYLVTHEDTAYEGYDQRLRTLSAEYATRTVAEWTDTWGGAWLYSLLPLLAPPPSDPPAFMRDGDWEAKGLNSWHGAWALMRYEPLPVRQPVVVTANTTPQVYVEPNPLLYARLAALTRQLSAGLDSRGLLDKEVGEKFLRMARLLDLLQLVSEKELSSTPLSDSEQRELNLAAEALLVLTLFPAGDSESRLPLSPPPTPFLTDVHINLETGLILQAAQGPARPIYVIVPGNPQPVLAVGAVFSTYEFASSIGQQMGQEQWQLEADQTPLSDWLRSLVAEAD